MILGQEIIYQLPLSLPLKQVSKVAFWISFTSVILDSVSNKPQKIGIFSFLQKMRNNLSLWRRLEVCLFYILILVLLWPFSFPWTQHSLQSMDIASVQWLISGTWIENCNFPFWWWHQPSACQHTFFSLLLCKLHNALSAGLVTAWSLNYPTDPWRSTNHNCYSNLAAIIVITSTLPLMVKYCLWHSKFCKRKAQIYLLTPACTGIHCWAP